MALLLILLPLAALAQTATGRVVARGTDAPLPQATVRLDGQPAGVSPDAAGRFQLPLGGTLPDARLIISHLGYESQTVPVRQLGPEVKLEELSYQIGEVLVTYTAVRKLLLRTWKFDEGLLDAAGQNLESAVATAAALSSPCIPVLGFGKSKHPNAILQQPRGKPESSSDKPRRATPRRGREPPAAGTGRRGSPPATVSPGGFPPLRLHEAHAAGRAAGLAFHPAEVEAPG